jgi:uncharacterized protein YndB with AHSA1/START domain
VKASIDISIEIDIGRPVQPVWAYLSDLDAIPEWIGEFKATRVESDGATGVGSLVHYTVEGDRSGVMNIVEWDPPHRLAWDGPPLAWAGGGARPRGSHTLTEAGEGRTRLVSRYQPELLGTLVFLRPYLKRWLRRQRTEDAQRLKARLEGQARHDA